SAAPEHRAGAWSAFCVVAVCVAFVGVTLGTVFGGVRAPEEYTVSTLKSDPQNALFSMLFLSGVIFLLASFGISGWMRSRGLGIATTSLSLVGALATFAVL